ncbi:mechanosensitive ion channel family protein [Robertkochia solimangrovi]|uniref:mechanosensitive ion channel family protein n=1 Tax=Robertkochia solimangrovi TaxID=2213046 RepID=UPI00117E1331|nr:mechanosensitive ion channel family protein [Robertkochia solimangrovi]TRZ42325.1 mechanosensitive ion channel family protein [Robertkochia solimangrovi]
MKVLDNYSEQILASVITLIIVIFIRYILRKVIHQAGKISDFDRNRTLLIVKYFNYLLLLLLIAAFSMIWGVKFQDLGLLVSSVFAVIGVAMFAQWSILSNVTAGVILFFSFPFKIGDRIRIMDKDFPTEAVIEDIKAFHLHLRTDENELVTLPNNILLQKGVTVVNRHREDDGADTL